MASNRPDYNSDAHWLENEIAELNSFCELARQRALQADGDAQRRQLNDIEAKFRARSKRLANILDMLKVEIIKAEKLR
jgi:hypothetical protein